MGTSGHNARSVFDAKIANTSHPITKGMKDFKIFDELYSKLQGDTEVEVLVSAYSDFSEKTEPLVFVLPYGKGRSVHNALGHDFKAILNPSMQQLISQRRGMGCHRQGPEVERLESRIEDAPGHRVICSMAGPSLFAAVRRRCGRE